MTSRCSGSWRLLAAARPPLSKARLPNVRNGSIPACRGSPVIGCRERFPRAAGRFAGRAARAGFQRRLSNSQTSLPRPKGVHVLSATTTLSVSRLRLARASRRSRNRVVPPDRNARARRQFRPVSRPRCSRRRVDTDVDSARRAPLHQFRLDQGNTPKQLMRRSPDITH